MYNGKNKDAVNERRRAATQKRREDEARNRRVEINHIPDYTFPPQAEIDRQNKIMKDIAAMERLHAMKAEVEKMKLKQEVKQEVAKQVHQSSHVCWLDEQTWWARVALFDASNYLIQTLEGAHRSEKEAEAWAVATERIFVNVWIVKNV